VKYLIGAFEIPLNTFYDLVYCGIRMISTINTAAHATMQVNATMDVAMITARAWSRLSGTGAGMGVSFILTSWMIFVKYIQLIYASNGL
jgi:hypothetical protein